MISKLLIQNYKYLVKQVQKSNEEKRNKRNNLFRIFDKQKKLKKCNLILGKIGRLFPLPVVVI